MLFLAIGQKLLLWEINHIKEQGFEEIILHVAEWNQNAVKLYCYKVKNIQMIDKTHALVYFEEDLNVIMVKFSSNGEEIIVQEAPGLILKCFKNHMIIR